MILSKFCLIVLFSLQAGAAEFLKLFPVKKPVIAAVMVAGDFKNAEEIKKAKAWAQAQADVASEGEMDGLLVEFRGGGILDQTISPAKMQAMVEITQAIKTRAPRLVVGVEILWHFPGATLDLAKKSQAQFVRLDFFADRMEVDTKEVVIDPKGILDYRKKIGAENIALLTDIQNKLAKMLEPSTSLIDSARAAQAGGSEAIVVSGTKAGSAPQATQLLQVQRALAPFPVVLGSGFAIENASLTLAYADAVIVGTSISETNGGPLLPKKVKSLMGFVKESRTAL